MTDTSVNDDGADPTGDIEKQNPGQATASGSKESPHKVEKLTRQDESIDPDAGSE